MTLTTIILLVLALYLLQLFLQETTGYRFNLWRIIGNRDRAPELSALAGRLERAKDNMIESLVIFLPLALIALMRGGDNAQAAHAALAFLIARIVYVPAYASGIPGLRSLAWLAALASLVMMALTLL